jgi:hypothetical protein
MNCTPLDQAYRYETQSEFIKQMRAPHYSPVCVFCSFPESMALSSDGSFRRCKRCKKDFKAKIPPFPLLEKVEQKTS